MAGVVECPLAANRGLWTSLPRGQLVHQITELLNGFPLFREKPLYVGQHVQRGEQRGQKQTSP